MDEPPRKKAAPKQSIVEGNKLLPKESFKDIVSSPGQHIAVSTNSRKATKNCERTTTRMGIGKEKISESSIAFSKKSFKEFWKEAILRHLKLEGKERVYWDSA